MKLGIPSWNGKISPLLDTAGKLLVIEFEGAREVSRFETLLGNSDIFQRCTLIRALGVETLICGAVSKHLLCQLQRGGVCVIPWISGDISEVVEAYMNGTLINERFLMPGCDLKSLRNFLKEG